MAQKALISSVFCATIGLLAAVVPGELVVLPVAAQPPVPSAATSAPDADSGEAASRLLDQAPFDVVVLNDKNRTTERVLPLALPQRRLPAAPAPTDVLRLRTVRQPDVEYEVFWKDIVEVKLFEQLLSDEARRLTAAKRFDEAFDYLVYLRRKAPQLVDLNQTEETWLVAAAQDDLAGGRWENALVACRRLQELNPIHAKLPELYGLAVESIVRDRMQQREPAAARAAVLDLSSKFPGHAAVARLNDEIRRGLEGVIAQAEADIESNRWSEAQDALAAALMLTPDSSRARALFEKSVVAYPRVKVGTTELAPQWRSATVGDWGTRRTRNLLSQPAFDRVVTAGDAPSVRIVAAAASWNLDERDEARAIVRWLAPRPGRATSFDAATALFRAAWPAAHEYRADAAATCMTLLPLDADRLEVRFGRFHPRPEALVGSILDAAAECRSAGAYDATETSPGETRWVRRSAAVGGVREIVERKFVDENEAVAALGRGEVDVVDRIAPWHVVPLQTQKDTSLIRYAGATVHALYLKTSGGPLQRGELRRAVAFAIDRDSILRNYLQPPPDDVTIRTAGGVFPAGRSNDDPLGYAHALTQPQRAYDPRRAFVLARLATFGRADAVPDAEASGSLTAPMLTLSHPPTAVAARAAERIQDALGRIGVSVELRRRSPAAPVDDADIVYFTASSLEPLIDAPAWFGERGPLPLIGRAAGEALRRLAEAESFAAARAALHDLQRIIYDEVLIVPLWQLNEYAAVRRRVTPATDESAPTSLYQFIDEWKVLPQISLPVP